MAEGVVGAGLAGLSAANFPAIIINAKTTASSPCR